jgi:glycosyltransferase involved in cell wall biosynthesis
VPRMDPTAPTVSVLMTTYNGAAMIGESIDSVLAQGFTDFELIVVDDSSTDATVSVLASYADPRIRALRNPYRLGIAGARNRGFAAVRGKYVAALDHDDISHPARLERQVRYLETHTGVLAVGTDVLIAGEGRLQPTDNPGFISEHFMRWMLLVGNPLTYSSMMVRAEAVQRLGTFMRGEYEPADDFDLYHRLLTCGDIVRLSEVLTTYRWHAANASHAQGLRLFGNAVKVLARAYRDWFGDEAESAAALVVRHLSDRVPVSDARSLDQLARYIRRLLAEFLAAHPLDRAERENIERHAGRILWRATRSAIRAGRPWLASVLLAEPTLTRRHTVPLWDAAASLVVGGLRAPGALWHGNSGRYGGLAAAQQAQQPLAAQLNQFKQVHLAAGRPTDGNPSERQDRDINRGSG